MNFDVKDLKSWANRHDVKIKAVTGFFGNSLSEIDNEIRRYNKGEKDRLHELYKISDNGCYCFGYAMYFADTGAFGGTQTFAFFLPLDAVKKDRPEKKYRPFKNLNEIQSVLCGGDVTKYAFFDVGTHLTVRRKNERNREQVILTISIEYMDGHLYLINYRRLDEWFNDFELLVNDTWGPFGIEVEDNE